MIKTCDFDDDAIEREEVVAASEQMAAEVRRQLKEFVPGLP